MLQVQEAEHLAQMEVWRSEAGELAASASKWKEYALELQERVERMAREAEQAPRELT